MAIQLRLTQRQIQKLALTPQMRLAIQLLQLPLQELRAVVEKEMVENPVLEEAAKSPETEEAGTRTSEADGEKSYDLDFGEEFNRLAAAEEDWKEMFKRNVPLMNKEEAQHRHELAVSQQMKTETLSEHLNWQLSLSDLSEEKQIVGRQIIGNINENGYLEAGVEDIAAACNTSLPEVESVLKAVQGFDPIGVAARSLKECLLLQLAYFKKKNTLAYEIVENHLDKLTKKNFAGIARELGVPVEKVREAKEMIAGLEPKPGRLYSHERPHYVVPDIRLQAISSGYNIIINERDLPHLHISSFYKNLMSKDNVDEQTKEYIRKKIRAGLWLIRSIRQRQLTLHKITEEIMKTQNEFLAKGPDHLKPLTLKEVAEATNLHESTVSRVVANKYVETPRGVFSLKQFFSSKIRTADGDFRSQKSIQAKIAQMIKNENPQAPLSDARITEHLRAQGINIARRTVAKYRQELKILPANLRKSG